MVELGGNAQVREHAPWLKTILETIYLFLPNLHNFNIRREAVLATQESLNAAITSSEMAFAVVYGVSYTAAVLLCAHLIFNRRNF
jgi:hypothetical protein